MTTTITEIATDRLKALFGIKDLFEELLAEPDMFAEGPSYRLIKAAEIAFDNYKKHNEEWLIQEFKEVEKN